MSTLHRCYFEVSVSSLVARLLCSGVLARDRAGAQAEVHARQACSPTGSAASRSRSTRFSTCGERLRPAPHRFKRQAHLLRHPQRPAQPQHSQSRRSSSTISATASAIPRANGCLPAVLSPRTNSYIHSQLVKYREISASNEAAIIEHLRSLSELIIYGDKHNEQFFEFFCEKVCWRGRNSLPPRLLLLLLLRG